MSEFKNNQTFYGVLFILFYGLPLIVHDSSMTIYLLLGVIPVSCLITSFFYGMKNGFQFFYPLIVMVLFTPAAWIFYQPSALIYIYIYGVIAIIGNFIGMVLKQEKVRMI